MKHIEIKFTYNLTEEKFRSKDIRDMIRDIRDGTAEKEVFSEDHIEEGISDVKMTIQIK